MFGIIGGLIGVTGFSISNSRQKSAERRVRRSAKSHGRKFYTDSHGVQRYVNTNRIASPGAVCPKPITRTISGCVYKIVLTNTFDDEINKTLPAIEWFDNYMDAVEYKRNYLWGDAYPEGKTYEDGYSFQIVTIHQYKYR